MITLLTNLTNLIHYDQLPVGTDKTQSADFGRIKFYRNHIAHNKDGMMESLFFNNTWDDISGVCKM